MTSHFDPGAEEPSATNGEPTTGPDLDGGSSSGSASSSGSSSGSGSASSAANGLLAQLQHLIASVASAPITREFAAKAAELAALAAEKTGPAARSLASKTEELSQSMADRANTFASSMRTEEPTDPADPGQGHAGA